MTTAIITPDLVDLAVGAAGRHTATRQLAQRRSRRRANGNGRSLRMAPGRSSGREALSRAGREVGPG